MLARLGLNLLRQKKYADAEPLVSECLLIRDRMQPDLWTTFNAKSMLGGALLGQNKYADAEPLLLQGYEGLKDREMSLPERARPRLTDAVQRLVELYDAWGKNEQANEWRIKLSEAQAAKPAETKKSEAPCGF